MIVVFNCWTVILCVYPGQRRQCRHAAAKKVTTGARPAEAEHGFFQITPKFQAASFQVKITFKRPKAKIE